APNLPEAAGWNAADILKAGAIFLHLQRILERTRADLAARRTHVAIAELERRAERHTPRGFAAALRSKAAEGPAIIAELKKSSPSKGLIREDFEPEALARTLVAN